MYTIIFPSIKLKYIYAKAMAMVYISIFTCLTFTCFTLKLVFEVISSCNDALVFHGNYDSCDKLSL